MDATPTFVAAPKRELTLFDSTCVIVGIIIGVGIYQVAPDVAGCLPDPWFMLGVWVAGGLISLAGALCYAELATSYPREGGDYVYLNRAYAPWAGFLFAWADLVIMRPGYIAEMAFPFATYALSLHAPFENPFLREHGKVIYAITAVLVLTTINILGVRQGKWTQNLLTTGKVLGILAIFAVAFFAVRPSAASSVAPAAPFSTGGLKLALIVILFTYGGWNEIAYVAAEVKRPERNILRSLVLGTLAVTALYLLINAAFLHTLGQAGMAASKAVAADTMRAAFPDYAGRIVSALVCLSALGAANGLIFAGARIAFALGQEHRPFRYLGQWSRRLGTPTWALAAQGAISLIIIVLAGSFNDALLYTSTVVWIFYLGTGLAVFVLRAREPQLPRPYKITGHPFTTLLFCASCAFLLYSAATYKWKGTLVSLLVLLAGLPFYWWSRHRHLPPLAPNFHG